MAYNYVQNDTKPDMVFNITRQPAGTVVDLTGSTVRFKIKRNDTAVRTNDASNTCTVTDAPNGICKYVFKSGDLPASTTYSCDLEITYADASIESGPKAIVISARAEA